MDDPTPVLPSDLAKALADLLAAAKRDVDASAVADNFGGAERSLGEITEACQSEADARTGLLAQFAAVEATLARYDAQQAAELKTGGQS